MLTGTRPSDIAELDTAVAEFRERRLDHIDFPMSSWMPVCVLADSLFSLMVECAHRIPVYIARRRLG